MSTGLSPNQSLPIKGTGNFVWMASAGSFWSQSARSYDIVISTLTEITQEMDDETLGIFKPKDIGEVYEHDITLLPGQNLHMRWKPNQTIIACGSDPQP